MAHLGLRMYVGPPESLPSELVRRRLQSPVGSGEAMALRRTIGSAAQAYLRRRVFITDPPPAPPSFRRPLAGLYPCRPFAASPHLVKKKKEEDDDAVRMRINNDITAPFIRLVSDEGHSVVPRHEALQLATRMEIDLVEVDGKADPPVCRIMDFHKEKYKKDASAKERLKAKSAIVLRGGDNKERELSFVRYSQDPCICMISAWRSRQFLWLDSAEYLHSRPDLYVWCTSTMTQMLCDMYQIYLVISEIHFVFNSNMWFLSYVLNY